MQDESFANSALRDLRELGMQLVLDNFDAGYSWLSYIYKYTFDSLKIDRSNLYPIFTIKNQAFSHVIDYDQPRAEFEFTSYCRWGRKFTTVGHLPTSPLWRSTMILVDSDFEPRRCDTFAVK